MLQLLIQCHKIKQVQDINADKERTLLQKQKRDLGETLCRAEAKDACSEGLVVSEGSLHPAAAAQDWERCKEQENHPISMFIQHKQQHLGMPSSSWFTCTLQGSSQSGPCCLHCCCLK